MTTAPEPPAPPAEPPAAPAAPAEPPAAPATANNPPSTDPKPEAEQFMTRADFKSAMDEWKREQDEAAARTAPAPKPKPAEPPAAPATPATPAAPAATDEPAYGNQTWFRRGGKKTTS